MGFPCPYTFIPQLFPRALPTPGQFRQLGLQVQFVDGPAVEPMEETRSNSGDPKDDRNNTSPICEKPPHGYEKTPHDIPASTAAFLAPGRLIELGGPSNAPYFCGGKL